MKIIKKQERKTEREKIMKKVRRREGTKAKYKESVGPFKSMVGPNKKVR
jgi:hypothetical protein